MNIISNTENARSYLNQLFSDESEALATHLGTHQATSKASQLARKRLILIKEMSQLEDTDLSKFVTLVEEKTKGISKNSSPRGGDSSTERISGNLPSLELGPNGRDCGLTGLFINQTAKDLCRSFKKISQGQPLGKEVDRVLLNLKIEELSYPLREFSSTCKKVICVAFGVAGGSLIAFVFIGAFLGGSPFLAIPGVLFLGMLFTSVVAYDRKQFCKKELLEISKVRRLEPWLKAPFVQYLNLHPQDKLTVRRLYEAYLEFERQQEPSSFCE